MRLISNCCGAKVAYEDLDKGTGVCCNSKEWCSFIDEDEEDTVCKNCGGAGCKFCDASKLLN